MFLCGIDSLKIKRMEKSLKKDSFRKRIFSDYENNYIDKKHNSLETAAGLWCAKEAFLKAYGTGITTLNLCEIGVCHDNNGAPYFKITGESKETFKYKYVSLSITHTEDTATAMVVMEK